MTQVTHRMPVPWAQLIKSDGTPASGWTLNFYESGTSTPQAAYSDTALSSSFTSLTLNSYGMPDVDIYFDPDLNYRVVIQDDSAATIFTLDNVQDFARQAAAHFQVYNGDPNGNVAGVAGSVGGAPSDVVFDSTNNLIYVCTTTGDAASAVWTNITASVSGAFSITGVLTPASFSTQQDDYNPTSLSTAAELRLNPGADSDVTGLTGGSVGRQMTIVNVNATYRIRLIHQSASSTAANRFLLPNGLDVALLPNYACVLDYDATTGRWRMKVPPFHIPLGNGQYVSNATFSFSVGSNALTIALKTALGSDPSPSDPVVIAFRSSTASSGLYVLRTISAALSLTVSAGSALGFSSSEQNLIHIGFIDNAGTPELAVSKDGAIWTEDRVVSTTAEGGSGGADSGTVLYSTTARSNVACRLAAVALITTSGTAGNWTAVPTRASLVTNNLLFPFKNSCFMWCNWTSITTTAINDAFNVSSLTDGGTGLTTINFAVSAKSAYYGVGASGGISGTRDWLSKNLTAPTASALVQYNWGDSSSAFTDANHQTAAAFSG